MPAKGTTQFGDDVVVGSAEYWKRWRAKNKDKAKVAAIKYRNKQRSLALAAKVARDDGIPIEQALAEVQGRADAISQVRSELINEGRIDGTIGTPIAEEAKEVEFIREMAEKFGVSYIFAFKVMNDDSIPLDKWDDVFRAEQNRVISE